MRKIIMFKNGIETQGYFSVQMSKWFRKNGIEVFLFDFFNERESLAGLLDFMEIGETAAVTFNFHGIAGEEIFYDAGGELLWDAMGIPCINIVVDHPMYYHEFFKTLPERYCQISIDRFHEKYMRRFFPGIRLGPFLPLAGTRLWPRKPLPEMARRDIDLLITGNYTPPHEFNKYIERIDREYADFYRGMIEDMLSHPGQTIEQTAETHLSREIPHIKEAELRETMANLTFIDLYVRNHVRGAVVKALADSGRIVHACGRGWDRLECGKPENLVLHGSLDSRGCLEMLHRTKISVNVMPGFKDGAHDRIYNSLLNGAVCISNRSIYLSEHFTDGRDICFYADETPEQAAGLADMLLSSGEKLADMQEAGYANALNGHTWGDFARELYEFMSSPELQI